MWERNLSLLFKHSRFALVETSLAVRGFNSFFRQFGKSVEGEDGVVLNRDFFVELWIADKRMRSSKTKRKQYSGRRFSFVLPADEKSYPLSSTILKDRSSGEPANDFLNKKSAHEDGNVHLLARSNLLITREIEWANLAFGFEQENRYAILDMCCPREPVGHIREKSNIIQRQLLRKRRPFVAYITDENGGELFRIRRPFWCITSSIYTEIDGEEVGVVHMRWHLWKRIYDLYLGSKQFAVVENRGLWNWNFTLKDADGNVLAEIDRNWRGFGFEILTDAGQYAIRFGGSAKGASQTDLVGIEDLKVARPLSLQERAVALTLAVSLDNDYFSRHGGWRVPFIGVDE